MELGEALGAELIVTGTVGQLGSIIIVTLSVLDTEHSKAVSRVEFQAHSLEEVPEKLDDVILRIARDAGIVAPHRSNTVLAATVEPSEIAATAKLTEAPDAEAAEADVASGGVSEPASGGPPFFLFAGMGTIGAGALGLIAGVVVALVGALPAAGYMMAYNDATQPNVSRDELIDAYGRAEVARQGHATWGLPAMVAGGVIAVVGVAAVAGGGALLFVE